jgi:hypothetical protein
MHQSIRQTSRRPSDCRVAITRAWRQHARERHVHQRPKRGIQRPGVLGIRHAEVRQLAVFVAPLLGSCPANMAVAAASAAPQDRKREAVRINLGLQPVNGGEGVRPMDPGFILTLADRFNFT